MLNNVLKDGVLNALNTIVLAVLNVAISVVIARNLTPIEMGNYSFSIWLIMAMALILSLGLPNALLRYGAEVRSGSGQFVAIKLLKKAIVYGLFLTIGWGSVIFVVLQIPFVANALPDVTENFDLIMVGFGILVFHSLVTFFAKSQRDYLILLLINMLGFSIILGGSYLLRNNNSVRLFIEVYLVGISLIVAGLVFRYLRRGPLKQESTQVLPSKTWRRVKKYGLSMVVLLLIDMVVWQRSEVFFLKWFGMTEEIAFYSVAYDLSSKSMRLIASGIPAVLLPVFAGLYGISDHTRIRYGYREATKYLALLTIPFATLLIVFAQPIILFLYSDTYLPSVPILRLLVVASAMGVIAGAGSSVIHALEKQNFMIIGGLLIAVFNMLGNWFLIPHWGAIGGAFINSVSQLLGVLMGTMLLIIVIKVQFPVGSIFRILIAAIIMGITASLISLVIPTFFGLLFSVLMGLIIFTILLWWMDLNRGDFSVAEKLLSDLYAKTRSTLRRK